MGEPPKQEVAAPQAADALAEAVRLYILEMDRSNFFVHFGKAKDRLIEMKEAVTLYYLQRDQP